MLIGLGHRARQGKDRIGQILAEDFGFKIIHFADALKEECAEYFGWTPENKNILARDAINSDNWERVANRGDWTVVNGGISDADSYQTSYVPFGNVSLLQWWGTNFRRKQDPDYWVKRTINSYAKSGFLFTAICDVRFPNEVEAIRMLNGLMVRVKRMTGNMQLIADDRDPNHESEIAIQHDSYFDITVELPDGATNEQFREEAWHIATRALRKRGTR